MTSDATANVLEEDGFDESETHKDLAPKQREQPWPVRVVAELVGTFLICFAIYAMCTMGCLVFSTNLLYLALGTGLVYAAVAVMFGKISGGHFNPAITVAAMLTGKTKILEGVLYIVAQVLGSVLAGLLIKFMLPVSSDLTFAQWLGIVVNGYDKASASYNDSLAQSGITFSLSQTVTIEILAAVIIVAVAMVTYGTKRYAWATGMAYAAGAVIALPVTRAGLNPARATGIAVFSYGQQVDPNPLQQLWVFWVCPVLAAALVALAMLIIQMVNAPKSRGDNPDQLLAYNEAAETTEGDAETTFLDTVVPPAQDEEDSAEAGDKSESSEGDSDPQTDSSDSDSDSDSEESDADNKSESDDEMDTQVGDKQSDAEADSDEGVKRD